MELWIEREFDRLLAAFEASELREEPVLRAAERAAARGEYAEALARLVSADE